ncbi:MAG: YfiR family protein [Bryobacteraceae bacterium]
MRLRLMLGIGATLRAAGRVSAQINAGYRVQAALLYNSAKFFEWPPDAWPGAGDPITVCALETNPSGGALDQVVEWETVPGQPLCSILFGSAFESTHILTILNAVRGRGVLTIGESPRPADRGAVIKVKLDGGHVRFEMNLAAADEQTLTLRSKLLSLADGHTKIA